jgi:hypothetical protein
MDNAIFYILIVAAVVIGYSLGRLTGNKDKNE